jgi:hypothetical protein
MLSPMTETARSAPRFGTDEQRWQAVVHRDRAADGAFYYSVCTTGVVHFHCCVIDGVFAVGEDGPV